MNIVATHVCETSELVAEIPEVTRFFEAEAQGLSEILEMVGEFDAAEAALALADMHTGVDVSADTVSVLLDEVLEALVAIPFLVVEHAAMAGLGPRDLHAAIR